MIVIVLFNVMRDLYGILFELLWLLLVMINILGSVFDLYLLFFISFFML